MTYLVEAVNISSHEDAELMLFQASQDLDLVGPNVIVQHNFADSAGEFRGTADELFIGRDDVAHVATGGVAGLVLDTAHVTILLNAAGRRGLGMMGDIVVRFDPANPKMAESVDHLARMVTLAGLPVRKAG